MKSPFQTWLVRLAIVGVVPFFLSSCGSSYSAPKGPTTYTIAVTVSGLTGTGLVLEDNGGDNLSVTGNGSFTFTAAIASGGAYAVTVSTQPSNPTQNCVATSGSGTASANVNIQVACTTTFTIGGTVSNLSTGNSVVLQDNGGNNLTVTANGNFTFTTAIDAGGAYAVTVSTPPSSPVQICTVANGSGSANANVTNITVDCGHNEWAWKSGSNSPTATTIAGSYGTKGMEAASNLPTIRNIGMVSWTDSSGNLWFFGGNGNDSTGAGGELNDLWKYNISSGKWTWVSGSNLANQAGVYPPSATPTPGGRDSGVGWIDSSGNLWLFGGKGYDSAGTLGYLNDLWEYSIANNQWTFKGGSTQATANQPGNYGALKVAAATNVPGGRAFSTVQNVNGVVWLFGGFGTDVNSSQDNLNDVWQYDINGGEWTWIGGADIVDTVPNYGTLGTPTATTTPGARFYAASWADKSGNIWLFGGNFAGVSTLVFFNDLWEFSNGEWTWKGGVKSTGDNTTDNSGVYGVQGTAAAANLPGPRADMSTWTDPSGNFWLFGLRKPLAFWRQRNKLHQRLVDVLPVI